MSANENELPETLPRWEVPDNWQWVSIADVGKVITGNTAPTKVTENYGNDFPFVKPPELTDRGIYKAAEGLSKTGMEEARLLPKGAVLVSCIGGLGKTGLAKVPVAFNQQINAIIFDERVLPEYGFYYAQTLKPWLYGVASATTLPIVNKSKFQRAPFPLAPLNQQKRIVAEIEKQFSRLDEAVANLKRVKANLKRYKAAVLKAAVEGRLVETEAELARREGRSYETGAELLQRIYGLLPIASLFFVDRIGQVTQLLPYIRPVVRWLCPLWPWWLSACFRLNHPIGLEGPCAERTSKTPV